MSQAIKVLSFPFDKIYYQSTDPRNHRYYQITVTLKALSGAVLGTALVSELRLRESLGIQHPIGSRIVNYMIPDWRLPGYGLAILAVTFVASTLALRYIKQQHTPSEIEKKQK